MMGPYGQQEDNSSQVQGPKMTRHAKGLTAYIKWLKISHQQ